MLRQAQEHDIALIQSVLNAPSNLGKLEAYSDDALRSAMANADMPVLVWEDAGQWQGFCWLRCTEKGTKIEEFGVSKPGGGVGARFFEAVLAHVTQHDLPRPLWLLVANDNSGAIRFYERFGFERGEVAPAVWHRREGPVADALRMVRPEM